MSFEKLPQIKPDELHIGCLNCSTAALIAPLEMQIAVGFGDAYVTRDGQLIYDGEADWSKTGNAKRVSDIEKLADADPDHDWRIVKFGPLHGETFQRHEKDKWVCIESNKGFA